MKITLIAIHQDNNKNIIAFRLLDEDTKDIRDIPYEAVKNVIQNNQLTVNGIELNNGKLKGSNGSFDRYPVIVNGKPVCNIKRIIILATIDDIGYRVSNVDGKITEASVQGLLRKRDQGMDVANGKIVAKGDSTFFSAINGTYPNIPVEQSPTGKKWLESRANKEVEQHKPVEQQKLVENAKTVEQKKPAIKVNYNRENDPRIPKVLTGIPRSDSKLKEVDQVTGMTVEQKLAYCMLGVQQVRPFYYSVLSLLKRVEASPADGVDTMAVSNDTLYFSSEFVLEMSLPELLFVLLHEVCHIAMKHRVRECGREHDAWNFATDYFINKHLASEFGLSMTGEVKIANTRAFGPGDSKYKICIPSLVLYNPAVDVDKDTPETIYSELFSKVNKPEKNKPDDTGSTGQMNGNQSGQDGNQSGQDGQSGGNQGQYQNSSESDDQGCGQGQGQGNLEQEGQEQVNSAAQQIANGMGSINNTAKSECDTQTQNEIQQGMKKIQQGAKQMNEGMQNGDNSQVEQGRQQIQNGLDDISSAVDNSDSQIGQHGRNKLQQDLEDMQSALDDLTQGANKVCDAKNGNGLSNQNNVPKYNESANNGDGSGETTDIKTDKTSKVDADAADYDKSSGSDSGESDYDASQQRQEGRFAGREFRGQEIPDIAPDMVDDASTLGKTAEQLNQNVSSLLSQAVTIHKQRHSFGGDTPDFLERYVEKALAPKVNWRSVLRRFLTKASQKEYTFAHPDKRFLGRRNADGSRQVFAGPHMADAGELENIKICIDTSGSISPKDIGQALAQIEDMFKQYRANAEMLYWDTRVRAVYPFKQYKELLSKEPKGGGGTDANCIFDYFETAKEYKLRKKPQPSLIIIFTDGYFGEIEARYKKKYKNTVWIIHDNDKFKAPFGVKAPLKIEN